MKDPYLQRADEVFAIEMEALEAVRQSLGSSFGQVVASLVGILNQRGKSWSWVWGSRAISVARLLRR